MNHLALNRDRSRPGKEHAGRKEHSHIWTFHSVCYYEFIVSNPPIIIVGGCSCDIASIHV